MLARFASAPPPASSPREEYWPLLPPAHPEKSAAFAPSTGQPEDGCHRSHLPPSAQAARRLAYPSGFAVRVRAGHATRSAPQRGERDDCGGTQLAVVSCRRCMPTAHAEGHIPVQLQRTAQRAAPPRGIRVGWRRVRPTRRPRGIRTRQALRWQRTQATFPWILTRIIFANTPGWLSASFGILDPLFPRSVRPPARPDA